MNKMRAIWNLTIWLVSFFLVCQSALHFGRWVNTGGCNYQKRGIFKTFPVGTFRPTPEICEECTCISEPHQNIYTNFLLKCKGCGVWDPGECELVRDNTLPHPMCCPTIKCA